MHCEHFLDEIRSLNGEDLSFLVNFQYLKSEECDREEVLEVKSLLEDRYNSIISRKRAGTYKG